MTQQTVTPAYSVDYQNQLVVTSYQKPTSPETTLWTKWADHFSNTPEALVCLSGGLDSQFAAWVLQKLGVKVHARTYLLLWEDNVANANDVIMSMRFAERLGIKLELTELDFEKFLAEQQHVRLAETYRCHSPQVTFHLRFLEQLGNSMPIVLGGEVPLLTYTPTHQHTVPWRFRPEIHLQPFSNFAQANGVSLTRDLFRLDAEVLYLSTQQYCRSVELNRHYVETPVDNRSSGYQARVEFYQSFGASLIPMLYKNHGFETVKKTLACRTGIYNQFDILYRYPLEQAALKHKWQGALVTDRHYRQGDVKQLLDTHTAICQQPGMTAVNSYSLDF